MSEHNNVHEDEEEEITLSVAAQMLADPSGSHTAQLSDSRPGIHLELTEIGADTAADDEWELDEDADMGLKVLIAGIDPQVAAQLLRVAAEFLDGATADD